MVIGRDIMPVFTGQHERTIDSKNRVQLPSQLRVEIDPERDGAGLYVTLGEQRHTLRLFTERSFQELSDRMETEFIKGSDSQRFEMQFYGLTSRVDVDKQGRFVLPVRLVKKARLGTEVYLVGQRSYIDIWNRADFDRSIGIDWDGDDWPDWQGFLRSRPKGSG